MCAQGLKRINGIINKRVSIKIDERKIPGALAFAVRNWEKYGPYVHWRIEIENNASSNIGVDGSCTNWVLQSGWARDALGVSGQGNSPNPPSMFANHFIVKVNSSYYDPSYALGPFNIEKDYEYTAFEGGIISTNRAFYLEQMMDDLINTYSLDDF